MRRAAVFQRIERRRTRKQRARNAILFSSCRRSTERVRDAVHDKEVRHEFGG